MTGAPFRVGSLCVRRRWLVLAVWLLVFAALAFWARALGPNVSAPSPNFSIEGEEWFRARERALAAEQEALDKPPPVAAP